MSQLPEMAEGSLARVPRARNAVALVFALGGLGLASWMTRIPEVRDVLELTPGMLGRLMLAYPLGALIALLTGGFVVGHIGAARTVTVGAVVMGFGLTVASLGADPLVSVVATAAGLVAMGYGRGSWGVAMNVEGAAIERLVGRAIMPRFHAAYSLGTVVGAGIGVGAAALGIPVAVHLTTIAVVAVIGLLTAVRHFLPPGTEFDSEKSPSPSKPGVAWREPRTLLLGILVMCFALIEGIAGDWLAVGLVDGYRVSHATGAAGFALFVMAMTAGRFIGSPMLDRFGRLPVLRVSAGLAALGVLLVVFGGSPTVAAIGVVLWGLGAALGFPLGMSAAADSPARAAARVSVVASLGFIAFVAGPLLVGRLGDHEGVMNAMLVAVVAAGVAVIIAPSARRPRQLLDTQPPPRRSDATP